MLFQVYGDNAIYQWIGWILVFCCLIGANELARRTKTGGVIAFLVIPAVLTVYFITIYTAAAMGADWALNNPTYVHMTSWFHYAKLYAATIGCIGFMALKYKWGSIGKSHWFKCFPFVIVAINILIAVVSDFESAIRGWGTTWDLHRRRDPVRWLAQRLQRRGRPAQHLLHDRLVRHLRLQEEGRHALAGHDLGVHRGLRPVELLLHLQLPAHPRLVLRPGAAAGTHRGQLLLEQGRLDSEPRQHAGHLVHVRAGVRRCSRTIPCSPPSP